MKDQGRGAGLIRTDPHCRVQGRREPVSTRGAAADEQRMNRCRVRWARLVVPIAFASVASPAAARAQDEPARGPASIVGEVRSDAGKPVAKSFVSIAALTRGAVSDARGRFALTDLPPGRARILVRAVGY